MHRAHINRRNSLINVKWIVFDCSRLSRELFIITRKAKAIIITFGAFFLCLHGLLNKFPVCSFADYKVEDRHMNLRKSRIGIST